MSLPPTLVEQVAAQLQAQGWMLTTAESCTGGLVAAACTDLAGSSAWFERGFVTYSNAAKTELLGVDAALIEAHGAVSEPVARAMAAGALARSGAQLSIAITGIAGPTGGSADKPVGTVWFGWGAQVRAGEPRLHTERLRLPGSRAAVRAAATEHALRGLLATLAGLA
ncbi:CinA family protein [Hylemonella sp. W303a]|uniref:CinA family protein n=1 Tax=Hylemonella sp. W303a TaxID=3389873 RepID=UPI00396B1F2C